MGKRVSAVLAMLIVGGLLVSCSTSKKSDAAGGADAAKSEETATPAADAQGQTAATMTEAGGEMDAPGTGENAVATMTNDKGEMVVVGNTVCPVSGHDVLPGKGYAVTFQGKKVNLCCGDCVGGFEKDAEAMAKKAGAI